LKKKDYNYVITDSPPLSVIQQNEQIKMKEDHNIETYFLRVDETVNSIIGLGEEVDESIIVQKVLRSLPMRFDPNISVLEERVDIESISMDELDGIFTADEMRTERENLGIKEATFKASKRSNKNRKKKKKEYSSSSDISKDDEEVANFVIILKKGTDDRYKGNLPLICFNYDGIGHFSYKCPHKTKKEMKKMIQTKNKQIKEKELKRKYSRKVFAPKKTTPHQTKMNSIKVKRKDFYSWK
jgi:hypothetical protein